MKIEFDQITASKIASTLRDLNPSYVLRDGDERVFNIASTYHHETGERAYMPGYHPLKDSPKFTLVNNGEMIIGLFMDIEEMDKFENSRLSIQDGYIVFL
jgi:hypothetical protein